jgi:hypothetical protein
VLYIDPDAVLLPRPTVNGLGERESDDEERVLIRIRRSAWAGPPICTVGA